MREEGVSYYLISSSDEHASEYVGDYDKTSLWLSGCSSDNVRILISQTKALLWTDGRYFISAAQELENSEYVLMKSGQTGVPSLCDYLDVSLKEGDCLAYDGRTFSYAEGLQYHNLAEKQGCELNNRFAPQDRLWIDRPNRASHPVIVLKEDLTGESYADKLSGVRAAMAAKGADQLILSKLDDIMWLLNIRGADIACNPVALSYFWLTDRGAFLFLQKSEITEELRTYAREQEITLEDYNETFEILSGRLADSAAKDPDSAMTGDQKPIKLMLDPRSSSDAMVSLAASCLGAENLILAANPTEMMKAVKNSVEISHIREVYLQDSVAVCRFIAYVKKHAREGNLTELSAARYLEGLRAELPGYLDLSFETICAYNANAAMAHYAPTKDDCARIEGRGFLLVDSGGQYLGGTTDVTRTICLGELTDSMREDFTTVAVSNLRLLFARFMEDCSGMVLDAIAREPLWERHKNFNHGTGHGIGYILNVHEGPQVIRWRDRIPEDRTSFVPGMITSDEPGMYIEGQYGIRTESITLCVEDCVNEYGRFLCFEPLTYVPIDLEGLKPEQMDASDIDKLNRYHKMVWEKISPFLKGEDLEWLKQATGPVCA
ncbi:peptidase, M24 family [Shuttleworthella satelles DSM 14600]|uniref:Peptidase, M24 family n=2 Tax=Shuttleworthella TaxID=177971 RepID=C4GBL9_9FIRM|nr:peptidase, M24 family [Shuttleworthia satelles DSM 14600]